MKTINIIAWTFWLITLFLFIAAARTLSDKVDFWKGKYNEQVEVNETLNKQVRRADIEILKWQLIAERAMISLKKTMDR